MVTLDSLIVQAASKKGPLLLSHQPQIEKFLKRLVLLVKKELLHSCFSMMKGVLSELIQTNFPQLLDE